VHFISIAIIITKSKCSSGARNLLLGAKAYLGGLASIPPSTEKVMEWSLGWGPDFLYMPAPTKCKFMSLVMIN
jgi:hypothetical protein